MIKVSYIQMTDIRDIKVYHIVSHERWNDAVMCYQNGNYFASVYLAGYCAECILKYVIVQRLFAQKLTQEKLINIKTICKSDKKYKSLLGHKINQLIKLGELESVFKGIKEHDFKDIIAWMSEWRYAVSHNVSQATAESFLKSVVRLSERLTDEISGNIKLRAFKFETGEVN